MSDPWPSTEPPGLGDRVDFGTGSAVWVVAYQRGEFALLREEADASSQFILPWLLLRPRLAS